MSFSNLFIYINAYFQFYPLHGKLPNGNLAQTLTVLSYDYYTSQFPKLHGCTRCVPENRALTAKHFSWPETPKPPAVTGKQQAANIKLMLVSKSSQKKGYCACQHNICKQSPTQNQLPKLYLTPQLQIYFNQQFIKKIPVHILCTTDKAWYIHIFRTHPHPHPTLLPTFQSHTHASQTNGYDLGENSGTADLDDYTRYSCGLRSKTAYLGIIWNMMNYQNIYSVYLKLTSP